MKKMKKFTMAIAVIAAILLGACAREEVISVPEGTKVNAEILGDAQVGGRFADSAFVAYPAVVPGMGSYALLRAKERLTPGQVIKAMILENGTLIAE